MTYTLQTARGPQSATWRRRQKAPMKWCDKCELSGEYLGKQTEKKTIYIILTLRHNARYAITISFTWNWLLLRFRRERAVYRLAEIAQFDVHGFALSLCLYGRRTYSSSSGVLAYRTRTQNEALEMHAHTRAFTELEPVAVVTYIMTLWQTGSVCALETIKVALMTSEDKNIPTDLAIWKKTKYKAVSQILLHERWPSIKIFIF